MKLLSRLFSKKSKINKDLFYSVLADDVNKVRNLLSDGADVNARNEQEWTSLMVAASEGYTHIVDVLLNQGADVNAQSSTGETPLMLSARWGHLSIVPMLLIDAGADPSLKNKDGKTALTIAKETGQTEITKLIEAILDRPQTNSTKSNDNVTISESKENNAIDWSKIGKDFYYNEAQALEEEGNYKEAEKGYRLSIENNPKFVAAHNGLGLLLEKQKRHDEAVEVFRKACDVNPENGIAFQNLAFSLINLNRLDEAEEIYKKAMRIAPGHPITQSIKSRLLKAKE